MIGESTKRVVTYIDEEEKVRLEQLAKADGRNVSNYVAQLIRKAIAENNK